MKDKKHFHGDGDISVKPADKTLLLDIQRLIENAKRKVAARVNFELTMLYWQIGRRIYKKILQEKRAEYGKEIVTKLSQQLIPEYGKGFDVKNLWRMIQFAECFPNEKIVVTLSRQLSWSHFVEIIPIKEKLSREFYSEMCRVEQWSVRTLRDKIDSMLFERTALSKKPKRIIEYEIAKLRVADQMSPDIVFKDPYLLNFLGLNDRYIEKDIEDAILREMESFLLELGSDFTFIARQKRITIDKTDYYIDLLFFHRRLHRLVAIELKLGEFKPADKGQMELYLRWLAKYEMRPGEELPVGLILCAGKKNETIELLEMEKFGIRVSQYLTQLPPREMLEKKLHQAIILARERYKNISNYENHIQLAQGICKV